MKDIFKGAAVKMLSAVLIGALVIGGGYGAVRYFIHKQKDLVEEKETIDVVGVLEEKLAVTAELNTADYLCTYMEEYTDQKEIKGWKIPFTGKSFTISYDGTVKAGISDLKKARIEEQGEKIVVRLPEIEITGYEIHKDTLKVYDETHNILNQISVEDVNEAQKNLEKEMVDRAKKYGLLEKAKENAQTVVTAMLQGAVEGREIVIEWQQ